MVTKVTRTNCPYCRLKKCLSLGMNVNSKWFWFSNILQGKNILTRLILLCIVEKDITQNQQIKILQCLVCSSPSSGIHFGVVTCEGCKGFFRRTIAQKSKLQCHGNGNCEIGSFTRNNCRSCRLNRCLLVGMSLTSTIAISIFTRHFAQQFWFMCFAVLMFRLQNRQTIEFVQNKTFQ